ncbi:MAG TPA: two-component system response regulator CreB [Planctomycetota bacterium]|nr:two-component system response regulator CreB [Planctomycetota bacterium]
MAKRILVVEDEPAIAETITYALSTEGFEPVWKATGREGLAALAAGGADLVILDVMLPDLGGFEVCREIRRSSSVPVIFLTARGAEVDRVVGLELGADDYVPKPFSPRELTARVKAVLRRSEEASPPKTKSVRKAARSAPFEVDAERCAIAYLGRTLALSRYEFKILRVLVERPGWVYSREKLMDMVWSDPGASMERTVDAHIKSIRAKLRAVRAEPDPIVTHRGLGYSLREDWG